METIARLCWYPWGGLVLGAALACTGVVQEAPGAQEGDGVEPPAGAPDGASGRPPSYQGEPGVPVVALGAAPAMGQPSPGFKSGVLAWRRLTAREYSHTVRDLLRDPNLSVSHLFPPNQDQPADGYLQPVGVTDESQVQDYAEIAESVARVVNVAKTLPCASRVTGADEGACLQNFILNFGRRAYRRPLHAVEQANLNNLFTAVRKAPYSLTFDQGIRVLLAYMLQAPALIYRGDAGPGAGGKAGDTVALTSQQLAVRLSYQLWGTMPDDDLFAAADAGQLQKPVQWGAQVRRMLGDPRAKDGVTGFLDQLIHLWEVRERDKDQSFKSYSPTIAAAFEQESQRFFSHVILEGDGHIETLLGAPFSFVNGVLAKFYGIQGPSGESFTKVPLPPGRAGLLTQGAFLSINADGKETNPTKRGAAILEHFLTCDHIATPDEAGIKDIPPLPARSAGTTRRQQLSAHAAGACAGCHSQTDPIGFAFENFNAVGEFVTTDNGSAIDPSGQLRIDDLDTRFLNAAELVRAIGKSAQFRKCFVRKWLRYTLTRPEGPDDQAEIKTLTTALERGGTVKDLLSALVSSPLFRYRQVLPGEVLP